MRNLLFNGRGLKMLLALVLILACTSQVLANEKYFFGVRFLGTTPLPCATGWKSPKNLCAEKGSPEKRGKGLNDGIYYYEIIGEKLFTGKFIINQ